MKTAVALPLKKSRKRKINVFLRRSCFSALLYMETKKLESKGFQLFLLTDIDSF